MTDVIHAGLVAYWYMIPSASLLIMWDWSKRRVPADFVAALVLAMWWPVIFFAVVAAIYEED
jgi:hypothetical protein